MTITLLKLTLGLIACTCACAAIVTYMVAVGLLCGVME